MNFEFSNFNMMLLSQPTHEEGKPRRQRWALASGGVAAGCPLSFKYLQKSTDGWSRGAMVDSLDIILSAAF